MALPSFATWAVFSGQGAAPNAIQELQKRIVFEWLPESGYEWAQVPDTEVCLFAPGEKKSGFQVWMLVVKV